MYHKLFCWLIKYEWARNMFDNILRNNVMVRLCNKPDNNGYVSNLRLSHNDYGYYWRWDGEIPEYYNGSCSEWIEEDIINLDDIISLTKSFLSDNECQLRRTKFDWGK